jgi:hypothetical protein
MSSEKHKSSQGNAFTAQERPFIVGEKCANRCEIVNFEVYRSVAIAVVFAIAACVTIQKGWIERIKPNDCANWPLSAGY